MKLIARELLKIVIIQKSISFNIIKTKNQKNKIKKRQTKNPSKQMNPIKNLETNRNMKNY